MSGFVRIRRDLESLLVVLVVLLIFVLVVAESLMSQAVPPFCPCDRTLEGDSFA